MTYVFSNLLLHYKISVISKPNETREQLEERLLHGFHAITRMCQVSRMGKWIATDPLVQYKHLQLHT